MISRIRRIIELRKSELSWSDIAVRALTASRILSSPRGDIGLNEKVWISLVYIRNRVRYVFKNKEKSIVIIETGVLGDCMLVVTAFESIQEYCNSNGYTLTVVCNHRMRSLFENYAGLKGINYVCFKDRDNISFEQIKKLYRQLNRCKYDFVILRDSSSLGFRIARFLAGANKLYYSYDVDSRNAQEKKMIKGSFTEIRQIDDTPFIPDVWKKILLRIGIEDYSTHLCHISVPEDVTNKFRYLIPEQRYIVICPEASNRNRSIDIDKLKEILSYLKKQFHGYRILLSTDNRDIEYNMELSSLLEDACVDDYRGKTPFDAYALLINHASLVIGCDTGSTHLASGLGVPYICLKGYWDRPHFLPYVFEDKKANDVLPIVLYPREVPHCAFCGDYRDYASLTECRERINNGKSLKCTHDIDNEDIFLAIERVMGGKNIDK